MPELPALFRLRQCYDHPQVENLHQQLQEEFAAIGLSQRIRPGDSVAITAGSRGIVQYAQIIRAIVDILKELAAQPFIVSAMGSHGGAVAAGQRSVLEALGITPQSVGAEIHAAVTTTRVGYTHEGIAVYTDQAALGADHVIICNRVKPHSTFRGEIQSGLTKMATIGLGNFEGAHECHRAVPSYGFDTVASSVFSKILEACPIVAGVAIVENGRNEIGQLRVVPPERFIETDRALVRQANQWLPRIPFRDVDLLIVDEIGKDLSGEGMDPKVIGRSRSWRGRSLLRRLPRAIGGMGAVYWKHVLTAPTRTDVRPIAQREFFETVLRRGRVACGQTMSSIGRILSTGNRSTARDTAAEPRSAVTFPRIKIIYARRLSPASHGNVVGIQRVDYCTHQLLQQADWQGTYVNCLAAGSLARLWTPLAHSTDREAISAALSRLKKSSGGDLRILRIRSTWRLEEMEASEAFLSEARERADLEITSEPRPISLCGDGNLPSW